MVSSRYGKENPDMLQVGELYAFINAGKDRKRAFHKALITPAMKRDGKNENRIYSRTIMLHCSQESWTKRRKRSRGFCSVRQDLYLTGNFTTFDRIESIAPG